MEASGSRLLRPVEDREDGHPDEAHLICSFAAGAGASDMTKLRFYPV
jgi:hypothetical protein